MPSIIVEVGKMTPISLWAASGTGFSWMVTEMPAGLLALDCITVQEPGTGCGRPAETTFLFLGLKSGSGKITFQLLRPFDVTNPAETVAYDVTVLGIGEDKADSLKATAGNKTFVPMSYVECEGENKGKMIVESPDEANCTVKYGGLPSGHCLLKYGMPTTPIHPTPIVLYAAQMKK